METPLVSIVMVNYNHEEFLGEAIDSVMVQTYQNWELIVIDDGSTDTSPEIIGKYEDKRIRPFFLEENRHICYATNYGFEKVKGEYVARLDSDDVWREDKLEKQMQFFRDNPQAEVCFTKLDIIDAQSNNSNVPMQDLYNLYNSRQEGKRNWIQFFFFVGNSLIQSTLVLKAELLKEVGGFNLAYMQTHDFDFFVRLIQKRDFYFLEEPLVGYRRLEKQNSSLHPENDLRFVNEYMNIRWHFFDDFSDELFIEVFQEYFLNKESSSPEELQCEKAFLLCKCIGYSDANPVLGLMKLEELFRVPEMTRVLKEKYDYTPKKFYKQNAVQQFYLPSLDQSIQKKDEEIKKLREVNGNQEDHIKSLLELTKQQQQCIEHLQNTMSWKLTKPLRQIKKIVKHDAKV